nr:EOG090X0C0Q [Cyclestheria hislopi]
MNCCKPSFIDIYTKYYCEENVWHLCNHVKQHCKRELDDCFVVFVSNETRSVPLWYQKAGRSDDGLVVWDYHVIFIHKNKQATAYEVYDLDSSLTFPCDFLEYTSKVLKCDELLQAQFHRSFRVIAASQYLEHFASDRRHMINKAGDWLKPPPKYNPILTSASTFNLDNYIEMFKNEAPGEILDLKQFVAKFCDPVLLHRGMD